MCTRRVRGRAEMEMYRSIARKQQAVSSFGRLRNG